MTISYAGKVLPTNEDNLSIFTFDQVTSRWTKVTSVVDKIARTVRASLPHFSLYTLSAEILPDTDKPTVNLLGPTNLIDLEGEINLNINAQDNNTVFKTDIFIDDRFVASDSNPLDGWSASVNSNDFSSGNHKLVVTAEDPAGNIGQAEYDFSIKGSTFIPPQILFDEPSEGDYLVDQSPISGTYSSEIDVNSISAFLDDVFIADLPYENGTLIKEIDWSQFKDGDYTLKVVLADKMGNVAQTERLVHVGVKVDISSPEERTYLHAEKITIEFESRPTDTAAKIDGTEVSNHSQINAYSLSLGKHTFTVEYKGKVVAQREFTVGTSIADQKDLVNIFWQEGRFKNYGIYQAVLEKLNIAEMWQSLDRPDMRDQILSHLIDFIDQQGQLKKPHIDSLAANVLRKDLLSLVNQK